jgi:hypothetical protein
MRRTSASPSATTTSEATATAPTKASGTIQNPPERASQTMKSRLWSATSVARSWGTSRINLRRSCTSNAQCSQSPNTYSSSASASASISMHLSLIRMTRGRTRTTRRQTSRAPRDTRILRTSSMLSSAATAASQPRAQKLTPCEILSVEPTIQRPLRYNEVPISFS